MSILKVNQDTVATTADKPKGFDPSAIYHVHIFYAIKRKIHDQSKQQNVLLRRGRKIDFSDKKEKYFTYLKTKMIYSNEQ